MTTNRMFLQDGTNFINDPSKESDPVKARQEKIHFLLGVNLIDVARNPLWKIDQIRALATGLVKTTDGKKRLHKDVLIENLKEFQDSERKTKIGVLEAMIEDGQVDAKLIDIVFLALSKNLEPQEVSALIQGELAKTYKSDISLVKTGLSRLFKAIEHDDRFVTYKAAYSKVREELKSFTSPVHKQYRADYAQQVENAQGNLEYIKIAPVMEFAEMVLSSPDDYKWQDVAFAIAIATGRRMAEILGEHSTWSVISPSQIEFTGLLKTKGKNRSGEKVVILSIIDAGLVVSAIDWLDGNNPQAKCYRIDHTRVNARYSKELSSRLSQATCAMKAASKVEGVDPEKSGIRQFKDCRDFFAAYHIAKTYDRNGTETETYYIQNKVLHHDDLTTSLSYQKYRLV